jgi:alkylation response protein AidB-like acyl-CoA dehydrogenase
MIGKETERTGNEFRQFVDKEISPYAGQHDREERVSENVIKTLADVGYLGATVAKESGGLGMDMRTFGLLNEELGRGCSAVRNLIGVQSMVTQILERWGSDEQKRRWLRRLAKGERIGAFALTEQKHGSDASSIETSIMTDGDSLVITGRKKWISFGQIADLILVFGRREDKLCTVLIEKDTSGLTVIPIQGLLGLRGSMLAELVFENCKIPLKNMVGAAGFGLAPIGFTALDIGRYSIAWGCVGMAQASLEASIQYAKTRKQFDAHLYEHQLIKQMIADMIVDIRAARLLCLEAGRLKESGDRESFREMLIAKYYAANMVQRVTSKAVELHGANGFSCEYPVERLYRDAKIMETIEGSNQMMQIMISKYAIEE